MNNSINLIGRVGQEPKEFTFNDNKKVVFQLAVKEFNGKKDSTLWVEIQSWNDVGDKVLSHVTKGREVAVSGRLSTTSFTAKDGTKETKPVIVLKEFYLCGAKPKAEAS